MDNLKEALRLAWNRQLYVWWEHYNYQYMSNALRRPVIELAMRETPWGSWDVTSRTLSISDRHIEREPWSEVMDTLRHEMAHQVVDEILKLTHEPPHGPAFRHACERLRCSAAASADPATRIEAEDDRIHRVLRKVLSLASSPNEHEARFAMRKAHEILLHYNIDLLKADQERKFFHRRLGTMKGRRSSADVWIGAILGRFFFVEVLWAWSYDAQKDVKGTVLEIYGTSQNLDMAEYVYEYLRCALDGLWSGYKRQFGVSSNRERQRYFAGVLRGFFRKLEEQDRSLMETHALIWKGDSELKAYYRHVNPRTKTVRNAGPAESSAYHQGMEDGRKLTIHKPIESKGDGVAGFLS